MLQFPRQTREAFPLLRKKLREIVMTRCWNVTLGAFLFTLAGAFYRGSPNGGPLLSIDGTPLMPVFTLSHTNGLLLDRESRRIWQYDFRTERAHSTTYPQIDLPAAPIAGCGCDQATIAVLSKPPRQQILVLSTSGTVKTLSVPRGTISFRNVACAGKDRFVLASDDQHRPITILDVDPTGNAQARPLLADYQPVTESPGVYRVYTAPGSPTVTLVDVMNGRLETFDWQGHSTGSVDAPPHPHQEAFADFVRTRTAENPWDHVSIEVYGVPILTMDGHILFPGIDFSAAKDPHAKTPFAFTVPGLKLQVFQPVPGIGADVLAIDRHVLLIEIRDLREPATRVRTTSAVLVPTKGAAP